MPRRIRINWPLWIGVASFLLVIGLFIFWPMLFESVDPAVEEGFSFEPGPADKVRRRGTSTITALWFFVFGSTIGSFLNVVAYRMPMGLTFVSKPSRCQYCETPILFKHNVPILGWLALRGRCAACRLPISPRYLMVEVMVGVMFFTLFLAELASGGRSLPIREPNSRAGVMWNLFTPQWDLIGTYAFHTFLLGVLATIALMKFDKLKIPVRLVLFSMMVAVVARIAWPMLAVLPTMPLVEKYATLLPRDGVEILSDIGIGVVVGLLLQAVIAVSGGHRFLPSRCGSAVVVLLVASYLGWQAIVPTLIIGSLIQLAVTFFGIARQSATTRWWAMSLLFGTWLTACFWRQLPNVWLPGAESPLTYQAAGLVFGLVTAFVAESMSVGQTEAPLLERT